MDVVFNSQDFIKEIKPIKKFFNKNKRIICITVMQRTLKITAFDPKTKIEHGAIIPADIRGMGGLMLNYPSKNFYELCETAAKEDSGKNMLHVKHNRTDNFISISSGDFSCNLPINISATQKYFI